MSKTFFEDVLGNEALCKRLAGEILSGSFSHAYLLEGQKGTGKHLLASRIAMALACEQREDDSYPLPCMKCPTCKKILSGNSPDLIFVNKGDKATLGVDPIRSLRLDTTVAPNDLERKIYVIEDAHLMTTQAQNALLLTLEEPPPYVIFLLLCETVAPILETVKSRAPTLRLRPVSEEAAHAHLLNCSPEARELERSAPMELREVLAAANGSIGQALAMLDPKARKPILARRQTAREFVTLCATDRPGIAAYNFIKSLPKGRDELIALLQDMLLSIRDLLLCKESDASPLCFFFDREEANALACQFTAVKLLGYTQIILRLCDDLERNANVRLTLTRFAAETGLLALPT